MATALVYHISSCVAPKAIVASVESQTFHCVAPRSASPTVTISGRHNNRALPDTRRAQIRDRTIGRNHGQPIFDGHRRQEPVERIEVNARRVSAAEDDIQF